MKYLLDDGRVVRNPWNRTRDDDAPLPVIVERIPERRDALRVFVRPFFLMLATCFVAAWMVGVAVHLGWRGAFSGAPAALFIFPVLAFLASATVQGVFASDEAEEEHFWRVLIGWAVATVVLVGWAASAHPELYGGQAVRIFLGFLIDGLALGAAAGATPGEVANARRMREEIEERVTLRLIEGGAA